MICVNVSSIPPRLLGIAVSLLYVVIGTGQQDLLTHFGTKNHISIPFELRNGHLLVKVRMDNIIEMPFIFDTGAEHTILFDRSITDLLGYDYQQKIKIIGADLSSVQYADICRGVVLKVGSAKASQRDIVVLNESNYILDYLVGSPVYGIIGGDYLKYSAVRLDFRKKRIHLYRKGSYRPEEKGYTCLSTTIANGKPYITIPTWRDQDQDSLLLLLDTGSPYPLVRLHEANSLRDEPSELLQGRLATTITGAMHGYMGRIDSIGIGPTIFTSVATRYQPVDSAIYQLQTVKRDGLLGTEALTNFDVYIDYLKEEVWVKSRGRKAPRMTRDRSGMYLLAYGPKLRNYIVESVLPGSPADEAGIMAGDVLLKINWRKSKRLSLHRINRKMRKRAGKRYTLLLSRKGQEVKRKITLRDY